MFTSNHNGENLNSVTTVCLLVPDGLAFLKLLISLDFHTTVSRVFTQNGVKQKASSIKQFCGQKHFVYERGQRRMVKTGFS